MERLISRPSTLQGLPGALVTKRHHLLVRWSHWLNVPILLGLILSGISIYWASPIYQHKPGSLNLDASGRSDPYYISIDLATARHPQTLLASHFNGQLLTVEHGAPLRLLVPVKLGLKNVKAITKLTYVAKEPRDYWAELGYSHYDGI